MLMSIAVHSPIDPPVCYDVKHMTEVAFWIHAVQFARPDQTVQQRSSLSLFGGHHFVGCIRL